MKTIFKLFAGIAAIGLLLAGCGDGGGDSQELKDLAGDNGGTPGGSVSPGRLGPLTDIGDLLAEGSNPPPGDGWYYSRAAAINSSGIVVGQANRGAPVNGAFSWNPVTGVMTFLGIHLGFFDDFYRLKDARPEIPLIYSEAVDINSSGTIIGNSTTGTGWPDETEKHAFIVINGVFIDLSPIPFLRDDGTVTIGNFSEAVDINQRGEVVLTVEDEEGRHAYYWDGGEDSFIPIALDREDGTTVTIDVPFYVGLGGIVGADSEAVAINESRQAVVNSSCTAVFHDLNWDVIESLNHLPGKTCTEAVDINDSIYTNNDGIPDGHVIGNSGNGSLEIQSDSSVRGFFWDGGAMYPVGDLGGGSSQVTDINDKDQVAGAATTAEGNFRAILWTLGTDRKGRVRDLGTLGGPNSMALAINEAGQVVGWSETGQFYQEQGITVPIRHAFLWDQGIMFDLGTHQPPYTYPFIPSFPFSEAVDINDAGQTAGNSFTINAHYRGFFLDPVFP